jgi:PAS domain S-box-containing protein
LAVEEASGRATAAFILERTVAGNSTHDHEIQMASANGAQLWVSLSSCPVMDRDGRALLSGVAAVDIGERKRAEEALRESEERFRWTFDESPVGAAMLSLGFRFLRVNSELCRLTGYREDELMAIGLADLIHPDDLDDCLASLKALQENECELYRADQRFRRKDGSVVWVQVSVRVNLDADGRAMYFLPMFEDITGRKNVEAALKESEEMFRALYESAPVPYQSLDIDGRIIRVNDAWGRAFGFDKAEVQGRSMKDFLTDDSVELFVQRFPAFKEMGEVAGAEFDVACRDGSTRRVSVYGRARLNEQGGFDRSHCVLWDITERRRAEQALQESEELHRTLVETMNEGLAMHDLEGRITYVNQRACELLGAEREQLIGTPILSFLDGESRRLVQEQMKGQPVPAV